MILTLIYICEGVNRQPVQLDKFICSSPVLSVAVERLSICWPNRSMSTDMQMASA